MVDQGQIKNKILVFLLLTFGISSVFYYIMFSAGTAKEGGIGVMWMWSPGIAAIITQLLFRDKLSEFGWRLGEKKYLTWGLLIPFLYALVIYGFAWMTGLAGYDPQSIKIGGVELPAILSLVVLSIMGLIPACFAALGEEIGWRGLLIPELVKITSFTKAALITGVIWAVWHFPAMIFAEYRNETSLWFQMPVFTVSVIGMSIYTAWFRLKSGSIWPVVLWHGAHNVFIQSVFMKMTVDTGLTEYFVDDHGLGVMLASVVVGYLFWRKRKEVHG